MSILLVGAFICLHFYEESVSDEFNAHNFMLKALIDDHKSSLNALPYFINHNIAKSDEDVIKLDLWNREIKDLKNLVANPSLKNLSASKQLFTKYGVDKDYLMHNGEISYITRFNILDGILNQISPVLEELQKREIKKRQKDIHVIISHRQNKYAANEIYELELEVVKLYNDMENSDFFVEINGKKDKVNTFPYFLPKNTNTGFIIGKLKDPVTGERRTIKKNVFP